MTTKKADLARRLEATLAELADLRQSLIEVQSRRDEYYLAALQLRRENDDLQAQLVTARQSLDAAREAIGEVNEQLRTATACKCRMIEVKAGDWRLYQTIDCPIHPSRIEVFWPDFGFPS